MFDHGVDVSLHLLLLKSLMVERPLSTTPEVCGSNTVIGQVNCIERRNKSNSGREWTEFFNVPLGWSSGQYACLLLRRPKFEFD